MARDVELVIKAKDAARSAIESITDALKDLTGVQDQVGKSATKTDSLLGELGNQLKTLMRDSQGLSNFGKIATSFDKANAAIARMETTVRSSASEFARLARESENAVRASNGLRGQIDAERAVIKANTAERVLARKELSEVNKALAQAERNQARYNKAIKDIPEPKRSRAAESASVFIETDINSARAKQIALTKDVSSYQAAIDRSREALKTFQPQLAAASTQEQRLAAETERAANSLTRQKSELEKARSSFVDIKSVAGQASTALGGMSVSQEKVSAASAKMAAELARTQARIATLSSAPKTTVAAPSVDNASIETQRRSLLEARREWVLAEAEVKRLAIAIKATEAPTIAMGDAMGRAQAQARLAKQEYQQQQVALKNLGGSAQSSFLAFSQAASRMASAGNSANRVLGATGSTAQQAGAGLKPIAPAAQAAGAAMGNAAGGANTLRNALAGIYGESRQSLSLFQRLRGELLSITAGYIGLQSAISNIGNVVTAFTTLEAAQSRLGAVFNQDTGKVRQELDFLERQAQRLGISFGVLSDQYAKFTVAANAANFSSENTRKIFLSVAEAGRVNKLSVDNLNGVFLALEQMISKGKVSSEELRRQMGDRLPGAFNIFAKAIGVTTAELDDMMRKGDVIANQDTLLKFADELVRRFGPQLGAALQTTTTEMGRFTDNVFQAQLRIAEGGFIEGMTNGLRELNEWFRSREGRDFFLSIGAALGKFANGLAQLPKYFDEIRIAISAFVGFKLAGVFGGIVAAIRETQGSLSAASAQFFTWKGTVAAARAQLTSFRAAVAPTAGVLASLRAQLIGVSAAASIAGGRFIAVQAGVAVMQASFIALRGVLVAVAGAARILFAALGGIPGIVLTGLSFVLGSWLTTVNDTTAAIDEHKRIMGEVIAAYDSVTNKTRDWAKEIKNVSLDQVNANLRTMITRFEEAKKAVGEIRSTDFFSFNAVSRSSPAQGEVAKQIRDLKKAFDDGSIGAKAFVSQLQEIYKTVDDPGIAEWAEALLAAGRNAEQAETNVGGMALAAKNLGNDSKEVNDIITQTGVSMESLSKAAADSGKSLEDNGGKAKAFAEALNEINKLVPGVGDELKRLGEIDALNKLYQDAVKLATTMGEVMRATEAYGKAADAINIKSFGGAGSEGTINLIKQFEGFQPTAKWDVNAFRAGYGSDTVTLADGSIQKIVEGMSVTQTDAMRDLVRRVGDYQDGIKSRIGSERFNALSPDQQAAITSIAYNYGSLPQRIVDAFKTGSAKEIADAIRGLASDNAGINEGRRKKEAALFEGGGDSFKTQQLLAEADAKRVEKAKEYNSELSNRLSLQEQENANGGKLTREAFIQKALAEEQKRAQAAGVELTNEQIAKITELAGKEYDLNQAKTEGTNATKEANAALQQAIALSQQRNTLQSLFNEAQKTGDITSAQNLQGQMDAVNGKLAEAIEKARAMWEAIGGPAADVALTKLETLKLKTQASSNAMSFLGLSTQQVGQLAGSFADGLVGVFDAFAQAIANGDDAMKALGKAFLKFAADFLRQIAQMILKQLILNALQRFLPGLGGIGLAHTGGLVGQTLTGSGNASRKVSAPLFAAAAIRYHSGGIAGLKPNEVPTILEQGEEVLTRSDPRHTMNGGRAANGAAAKSVQNIRNILVLDDESAANWFQTPTGEAVIMSTLKKNAATVRRIVG